MKQRYKTRLSILLLCLFAIVQTVLAQTSGKNYVTTSTMLDAEGKHSVKDVQYYDGFGRPDIVMTNGVGTSGKYVCSMVEYDGLGRVAKKWLPAVGGNTPDYIDKDAFVSRVESTYRNESRQFAEMKYSDCSTSDTIVKPGTDWEDHYRIIERITNKTGEVKKYVVENDKPVQKDSYVKNTLLGEKVTDEDGNIIEVYRDFFGNVVLERRNGNNDTYYVYDRGRLCFVLPPLYQEEAKSSLWYKYKYDERGRCIEKTLPGCKPIKYWYDRYGRLAFMQDARMRSAGKYRFYLYDGLNRLAVQGLCTDCANSSNSTLAATVVYGGKGKQVDNIGYRTVESKYVLTSPSIEIVNYYDGYDCLNSAAFKEVVSKWNLKTNSKVCTTTLQTAQIVTDNNGGRYFRVLYYDAKGRCVEANSTWADNYFIKTNKSYSFTGKPTKSVAKTYKNSLTNLYHTFVDSVEYSEICDLPVRELIKLDNNPEEIVAENVYDELGRLIEQKSNNGNIRDLYQYNIQGWLTCHENYDNKIYSVIKDLPVFKEKLYYQDGPNSEKRYNGNISSYVYSHAGNQKEEKGYLYSYDKLNRLISAKYMCGSNLNVKPKVDYSEEATYNANGSVLTMKRKGNEVRYGYVDNLEFKYSGNQLFKVSDGAFDVSLGSNAGFVDGFDFGVNPDQPGYRSDYDQEYEYDECGSLISDKNKKIQRIYYDFNGMPSYVLFENGSLIEYVYTADGVKLKTIHRTAVEGVKAKYRPVLDESATLSVVSKLYVGMFEISNSGHDDKCYFGKGYAQYYHDSQISGYYYFIKDYLGNIRHIDQASNSGNNWAVQISNFYPFGNLFNDVSSHAYPESRKFGSKEFDSMHGLNLYDFSARQYDPSLGQFTAMDPLCEKYYHLSPYAYCGGNPVNYIDPTGMKAESQAKKIDCYQTSDPELIRAYLDHLANGGDWSTYNFNEWAYKQIDGEIGNWEGCIEFWRASHGVEPIYGGYTPDGNHILWGNKEYGANMLDSRSWTNFCNFINGLTYSLQPAYSQFTPESDYSLGLIGAFGENANDIRLGCNDKFYFRNYTVGKNKYGMPKIIGDKKFVSNLNSRFLTRASRVVTAYSLYVGAKNSFNAYKHGGPNALYNATMQGGKCVGNVLGAMAGAQIGQYVGGVIGACFGGAGAVPGAIIGNVVGGWVGGMAGEWAGETMVNSIFN